MRCSTWIPLAALAAPCLADWWDVRSQCWGPGQPCNSVGTWYSGFGNYPFQANDGCYDNDISAVPGLYVFPRAVHRPPTLLQQPD